MASNIKILDPVQGLIDYVNDIKPYHSKVIEALIEYVGSESIDVTVFEDFDFKIGMLYEFDGVYVCLLGGYGTPSFGDPENILVLSPDVTKTVLEYPAIGDGFFITLGDKTSVFDPAVNIDLAIASSVEDKLIDVTASSGSPLGEFYVTGDKTATYFTTANIRIVGSLFNDANYTVATSVAFGSPVMTRITVNEPVPTNGVEGFVSVPDAVNSGTFTVLDSEYVQGHLIPHTIVYMTGVTFVPPTLVDDNQRFVSLVSTQPLVYSKILGYSSALRLLETESPDVPYYVADEGLTISSIVALTATSFSVLGNFESSNIFVGDELVVADSSGNDGTYIITSITYSYAGSPVTDFVTTFGVASVPDTNVDGNLKLHVPSNVFIIDDGDYTNFFVQGSRVNATSGSHVGVYTTLNSRFINNKTYIRVRETLIDEGHGKPILSTGANYISVDGDETAVYGGSPAQQFNIVGSLRNDGSYTTASAVYSGVTNTTQISIIEPFDITDASGEIYEFDAGDITYRPEGFGATLDLCELVPQQLTNSTITEHFDIVLGYKFVIDGTESGTNKIYIQDNSAADIYNIFTKYAAGSPPIDTLVTISESGINNGTYTISDVTQDPGVHAILDVTTALNDSGIFAGSPAINGGVLRYREWYQYYITFISGSPNAFIVAGDATADMADTDYIRHIFTNDIYTVSGAPVFDGINTTIAVIEPIVTIACSPAIDVTAGSPPFDDWIISI